MQLTFPFLFDFCYHSTLQPPVQGTASDLIHYHRKILKVYKLLWKMFKF